MTRFALVSFALASGCALSAPAPQVAPEPSNRAHATPAAQPAVAHAEAAPTPAAQPAAQPSGATQRLGAPLTATTTVALADILQNASRYSGQTVRTEGTVTAVCQAMGCWMQLGEGDGRVHVRMHGHSFFIPRNASGRHARVQATVVAGEPNGHCEQEAAEQTGHVARVELDATGVELD